jgi:DNA-binding response OmpR family regulator
MRSSVPPTIMVVEDEEVIGMFLSEQLRDAGFPVRVLPDAASALSFLEEEAIGAAIIDVGLPDSRGDDLARQCHSRWPTLPIILTTGYDEHPFQQAFGSDPYVRVMGKPFDTPRLLLRLEELAIRPTRV